MDKDNEKTRYEYANESIYNLCDIISAFMEFCIVQDNDYCQDEFNFNCKECMLSYLKEKI